MPRSHAWSHGLLDAAEGLYERSAGGIAGLPLACRPAIHAARLIYREIGRENRPQTATIPWSRRAVVPTSRKLTLLAAALGTAATTGRGMAADPLPETRFLVDAAVLARPIRQGVAGTGPFQAVDDRIGWVIELFEKMEERQHAAPAPADRDRALAP